VPAQDFVGEIDLQIGEIAQQRLGCRREIRHAGRIGADRRERAGVRGSQAREDWSGAPGKPRRQRDDQVALAPEPLH
jgi:hypothetical protein